LNDPSCRSFRSQCANARQPSINLIWVFGKGEFVSVECMISVMRLASGREMHGHVTKEADANGWLRGGRVKNVDRCPND